MTFAHAHKLRRMEARFKPYESVLAFGLLFRISLGKSLPSVFLTVSLPLLLRACI